MRVFKGLKRQVSKSIKVLKKHFGAPADIYFPLAHNNKQHGFLDEDVTYDEGRRATVLIPAIFRKQNETLALLDTFYDPGEFALFEEHHILWPKYSKIVVRHKGAIRNFIINDIQAIRDDNAAESDQVIFRKYILVPSNSVDVERNRDELVDALNREKDPIPGDSDYRPEESIVDDGEPTDKPPLNMNRIK